MSPTPIPNSQEVPKLHLKSTLESPAGVFLFKIFFPGLSIAGSLCLSSTFWAETKSGS